MIKEGLKMFAIPPYLASFKAGKQIPWFRISFIPNCIRGRTYIICIVWGQNGWFAEVEEEKSGKTLIPSNFLRKTEKSTLRL